MLLPEIVEHPDTRLTPVSRGRALEEILKLTLGIAASERTAAKHHFALLGRLVRADAVLPAPEWCSTLNRDLPHAVAHFAEAAAA